MLLSILDTPYSLSQVMAFSVDFLALSELRLAMKAFFEVGDVKPLQVFWQKNKNQILRELQKVRYEVDCDWIHGMISEATAAAKLMNVPVDFSQVNEFLGQKKSIRLPTNSFLNVAANFDLKKILVSWLKSDPKSARFLGENRIQAMQAALLDLISAPADEPVLDPMQDAWAKLALLVNTKSSEDLSYEMFQIQGALSPNVLITALVGADVKSSGPGPFITSLPMAKPFQDIDWSYLPIFEQCDEILFPFQILTGPDLAAAREFVLQADPLQPWQQYPDLQQTLKKEDWQNCISQYWPNCQKRFSDLLTEAEKTNHSVVLTFNDLGHPIWPGNYFPKRVIS